MKRNSLALFLLLWLINVCLSYSQDTTKATHYDSLESATSQPQTNSN